MSLKTFFPYFVFQLTTSRRGRLRQIQNLQQSFPFQLTTSRRGRPRYFLLCTINFYFNSRPHEEVDAGSSELLHTHHHFNSRPHEEVDYVVIELQIIKSVFQLTTSRRGRLAYSHDHFLWLPNFNSRPHEEVDHFYTRFVLADDFISTHDLTKRSTKRRKAGNNMKIISTHDLTKRSTHIIQH